MAKYDLSTFTWYDLEPRTQEMAINVSDSSGFTFNKKLRKHMPAHFRLCASPDMRVLGIAEATDRVATLPKSGSKKIPKLLRDIKNAGVILPARYVFRLEDGMLFGELKLPESSKSGAGKRKPVPQKPRNVSNSQEEHLLEDLQRGKLR